MLTESFTIDSRWSKNAWCKVAALQFTIHLIPEVTHDVTVRQVVDCKVMTAMLGFVVICICKYTWSQQVHLKVHGENHDVIVSFGLPFYPSFSVLTLLFSFHAPWSPVQTQCHIYVQDTHCADLFLVCSWQCFASSFPWVKLVWTLGVFLWNHSTLETLCTDVCVK